MVIHHELLPDSYLLILAPSDDAAEVELAYWLRRARRSGKPAVWVDCSLLTTLSAEGAQLLWVAYHRLQQQRVQLVLVHVPQQMQQQWFSHQPGPCILPTLLDAAQQRWHPAPGYPARVYSTHPYATR